MCFSQKPPTANPIPPASDTTAASQLNLGTASVQSASTDVLGRLGLTNPKPQTSTPSGPKVDATSTQGSAAADLGITPFYKPNPITPP